MNSGESFIDVDFRQRCKRGQNICGDVFLSRKIRPDGRVIAVLSDGLGSGVKASVLASLTATMAMKYTEAFMDIRQSAKTIMETLPICEVRKISYSTFTILDIDPDGDARLIEHGNPELALLRRGREIPLERSTLTLDQWKDRLISYSEFHLELEDRLICFSDGVSQSGMGRAGFPLGWGRQEAVDYVLRQLSQAPQQGAGALAEALVAQAQKNDQAGPCDDITAASMSFRPPRRLLVLTGPPFQKERDRELAELAHDFPGRKAICGGTTASIVGRLLGKQVSMDLSRVDPAIPPSSRMEGIDLVTEGTLTLARVAQWLEHSPPARTTTNAATELLSLMLDSDIVQFIVGTRINEAHQDPNVPVELDLRRNIVRRIASLLESRYLKETVVRYL